MKVAFILFLAGFFSFFGAVAGGSYEYDSSLPLSIINCFSHRQSINSINIISALISFVLLSLSFIRMLFNSGTLSLNEYDPNTLVATPLINIKADQLPYTYIDIDGLSQSDTFDIGF